MSIVSKTPLTEEQVLKVIKSDFQEADKLQKSWISTIKTMRNEYYGEPYGNERKGKSALVSQDIRRQSEWLLPTLVDPFVSTSDIIRIDPIGSQDRDKSRQKEMILNTQFCRQFPRFQFMNDAVKVLDMDGTVVIKTSWEYDEETSKEYRYTFTLKDGSEIDIERYQAVYEEQKKVIEQQKEQIKLDMFSQRREQEEQFQQLTQQMKQIQVAQERQEQIDPQQYEQITQQYMQLKQVLSQPLIMPTPPAVDLPVVLTEDTIENINVIKNKPNAEVCRNEDVYIDPTCRGVIENAEFFIYRYESSLSKLRADGRFRNLHKVVKEDVLNDETGYESADPTSFHFSDEARKKVLVHEYWGNIDIDGDGIAEPIVCSYIGDVIISLKPNPYPDKKPPFIVCKFMPVPFNVYGESNGNLISDHQKLKTAVMRGIINEISAGTDGQIGIKKGMLDIINKPKFFSGENFEFNGTAQDFFFGNFNQLPQSIFSVFQVFNNEVESITGTKAFSQGLTGQSLGSTATAAKGAMDAQSTRRLHLVRNISENLVKPLLRKWLAYDIAFLDEKTILNYTDDSTVAVVKSALEGEYDLDINISTNEDNQAKGQQLVFMLQTLGNNLPFELTTRIMAEMARLNRMPDFAKELLAYKPEPDPIQEQMKQLQVQMLQAQIANETAKGKENEIDVALKQTKAQKESENARKIGSEADLKDLEFLMKQSGADTDNSAIVQQQQAAFDNQVKERQLALQAQKQEADFNAKRRKDLLDYKSKQDKIKTDFDLNLIKGMTNERSE